MCSYEQDIAIRIHYLIVYPPANSHVRVVVIIVIGRRGRLFDSKVGVWRYYVYKKDEVSIKYKMIHCHKSEQFCLSSVHHMHNCGSQTITQKVGDSLLIYNHPTLKEGYIQRLCVYRTRSPFTST